MIVRYASFGKPWQNLSFLPDLRLVFMDLKKLYIEKAVYPAMTLLQHNRVTAR